MTDDTTAGNKALGMRILCIDDEPAIRLSIQSFLQDLGHTVETAPDGEQGLARIESSEFDGILLDLSMPGMSGLEVLKRTAKVKPALPVVVISGTGTIQDVISALRLGAWDFITKPIKDMAILLHALNRSVERARLITENQQHKERLEALVAERTQKLQEEITERKSIEKALRASLAEKEVLLKEVHHRVKNNLQIVSSLLSLQSLKFDDDKLAAVFLDSQARVRAMALVHEKLYRSKDLSCIDFPDYLRQLSVFLLQAYSPKNLALTSDIQCKQFFLPVDSAIPCGLILTEIFTNSLKHAFAGRSTGHILLHAWQDQDDTHMVIEDDGIGLRPGFIIEKADTLGLQLVTNLTRQLQGTLGVSSVSGKTSFHLSFPLKACPLPEAPLAEMP